MFEVSTTNKTMHLENRAGRKCSQNLVWCGGVVCSRLPSARNKFFISILDYLLPHKINNQTERRFSPRVWFLHCNMIPFLFAQTNSSFHYSQPVTELCFVSVALFYALNLHRSRWIVKHYLFYFRKALLLVLQLVCFWVMVLLFASGSRFLECYSAEKRRKSMVKNV